MHCTVLELMCGYMLALFKSHTGLNIAKVLKSAVSQQSSAKVNTAIIAE